MTDDTSAPTLEPHISGTDHSRCLDCSIDTIDTGEYYMLRSDLWRGLTGSRYGYLCIGCLEARLGRRLRLDDFMLCPLNCMIDAGTFHRASSARLRDRLAGMADVPWGDD